VSSAFLYLAIIAIWAVFLVPAWVRRPHANPRAVAPGEHADDLTVEHLTETENDVEVTLGADVHVEVSHDDRDYRAHQYSDHEYSDEPLRAHPYPDASSGYAEADYAGYADYDAGAAAQAYEQSVQWQREPGGSGSREQMLRARRKILKILIAMTLVTGGFVALGAAMWWICAPPAGMLVLYVLLLRETALADAEQARRRAAWAAAQARAYRRHLRAQAERDAYAAAHATPGAQIIDISGRVTDQLYDQYADAAVRAVGD